MAFRKKGTEVGGRYKAALLKEAGQRPFQGGFQLKECRLIRIGADRVINRENSGSGIIYAIKKIVFSAHDDPEGFLLRASAHFLGKQKQLGTVGEEY